MGKRESQQDTAVLRTFYQLIPFSPLRWALAQGLGGVSSTPSLVPLRVIATTVSSLIYYVCQNCARFPMRDARYGRSRVTPTHAAWSLPPISLTTTHAIVAVERDSFPLLVRKHVTLPNYCEQTACWVTSSTGEPIGMGPWRTTKVYDIWARQAYWHSRTQWHPRRLAEYIATYLVVQLVFALPWRIPR